MNIVRISKDAICPKCKNMLSRWYTEGGQMYRQCVTCRLCYVAIDTGLADTDVICQQIPTNEFIRMMR